jgi:hypothetical protein
MAVACLLTLLALCGIGVGVLMGQSRALSSHLGAAGGGLLFGIALFWLIPELATTAGRLPAFAMAAAAACVLMLLDWYLTYIGHSPRHGIVGPLLIATAIHSFLDGWSVRALTGHRLAQVAVPIGLSLHKVPEGVALGWITRKSMSSAGKAATASAAVELFTLAGALIEPAANRSGAAAFGAWWTAGVLAVISGSFLFLGLHAVWPSWRRPGLLVLFLASLALMALVRP